MSGDPGAAVGAAAAVLRPSALAGRRVLVLGGAGRMGGAIAALERFPA